MTQGLGVTPSAARKGSGALSSLRRMRRTDDEEFCELCQVPLRRAGHRHLLEPGTRQIKCSCTACSMLFPREARQRFVVIPQRRWRLVDFELDDGQWDQLAIPVGMAYLHTTEEGKGVKAFYPGPAGATESLLEISGWEDLVERNPVLSRLEPDVEALLVDRVGGKRDHFIVPIDACYELVGLIRVHWRGLSGGTEAWEKIAAFFAGLRAAATEHGSGA